MKIHRKLGITVGVLFILGTVSGILSFAFTGEINGTHEYLLQIASNHNQYIIGSFLVLIMGLSLAFIPFVLYPTLSKYNKQLAIGYVVFRGAIETVLYLSIWISMLLLLFVGKSQEIQENTSTKQIDLIVSGILKFRELNDIATIFIFGISGLFLYIVFYQSKLVPKWIAVWGLIAIVLYILTGFLMMFEITDNSTYIELMSLPIFLQEMVMGVWLIIKGFNPVLFEKNT